MPDKYREVREVQHTQYAGALLQQFLKRMDDAKKLDEPKVIDVTPARTGDVRPLAPGSGSGSRRCPECQRM